MSSNESIGEAKKKALHVAVFPWLGFGHIIPFLEVAKHIARRGHRVSFISTPRNIQRLPKIQPNLTPLINLVQLPMPRVENLPENAEATTDVPQHLIPYLMLAYDGLEKGVSNFLETNTPDWIIYDFTPYWLPPIATKLGISRAYFSTSEASAICFFGSTAPELIDRYRGLRTMPEHFTVPPEWVPFPSKLAYKPFEANNFFAGALNNQPTPSGVPIRSRLVSTVQGCEVYLIRSCREIEGDWLDLLQELHGKPVVPVGLLLPPLMVLDQDSEQEKEDWTRISDFFLDKQEKGTVVYIALGSEANISQQELTELALGLELSGLPFFWVFRFPSTLPVKLPEGFEDRVKGRGLVWKTWAPQHKILGHDSVGGFLTHCGASSLLEGLHCGRPLIMLPIAYDQCLLARVWEEKKVGVEVPRDEQNGALTRTAVVESLRLVVVDEEGKAYRDKAKEYSALLFGDNDLRDYRHMDKCVEYLEKHLQT